MFVFQKKINTITALKENIIDYKKRSYFNTDEIPLEYRDDIYQTFFKKMKKEFIYTINKISEIKDNTRLLKIIKDKITKSLQNNKQIFDKLREIEATEDIMKLGLFDSQVIIPGGIPIKITPEIQGYQTFFEIIRKYVFNYNKEWIKGVDASDFIFNKNELKLFPYLPLYCYIKQIFTDGYNKSINLTDLFSQIQLEYYCYPTLQQVKSTNKKEEKKKDNPQKKKGGQNPEGNKPKQQKDNKPKQQKDNKPKSQKNNKPKQQDKKERISYFDSECYANKTENLLKKNLKDKDKVNGTLYSEKNILKK